ncbi:hypothetical protein [Micrococcus sp. TA1]|uniref:hypothetical protein n=1 Tax=Micrococcus sp. TA1 TaxID=681627 RepID=UPI00160E6543|nr:hypothetical protein [Micrococcus sp. TA1]MBB5749431.1 hypothetical protein [Micrococcus sp. TA1]
MRPISRGGYRLVAVLAGVALLTAAGAGCARQDPGGGDESGGSEVSGSSTAHSAPTQDTGDAVVDDEPRDDLTGQQVVEWTDYEVVSERELRFHFPTGTPDCYGSRTAVEEDDSGIRVATIVGLVPGAPENCALVGRTASIVVTTETPVGDRTVEHLEVADEDLP